MKITYLIETTAGDDFKDIAERAVSRRKRSNCDEFILNDGNLIRVEKDDTVESLFEKYLKAQPESTDEMQPETIQGDVPNPKWAKLREQAAITIGAAKFANSNAQTVNAQTVEEIAQIAKSSVDFATMLVRQLEFTE